MVVMWSFKNRNDELASPELSYYRLLADGLSFYYYPLLRGGGGPNYFLNIIMMLGGVGAWTVTLTNEDSA